MTGDQKQPSLRTSRLRRLAARFGLLAAGCVVGLMLAEAMLRLLGISYPLPYMPDPHCGSRLRPGFSGWFSKEGNAYVRINRAGFRDREHTLAKPPETIRIAVLGDSFAEAVQVPLEQAFWFILQEELMRRKTLGAKQVEVLNFGVSGHGTAQQLQILRHHVWPYSPDIVLLAFFAGNDIRNNSRHLEPYHVRPFFQLVDGKLELDDQFLNHPDYLRAQSRSVRLKVWLINRFRLLQVVAEWRNRTSNRPSREHENESVSEDHAVFQPPPDEHWRQAWEVTERIVEQMHNETNARGAEFWLAMVTQDIQVHPDPAERERFCERLAVADLDYPERRMAALGARVGFPVVSISENMRDYAEGRQLYLHGFANSIIGRGHWNKLGHRLAGESIAEAIHDARGFSDQHGARHHDTGGQIARYLNHHTELNQSVVFRVHGRSEHRYSKDLSSIRPFVVNVSLDGSCERKSIDTLVLQD